MAKKKQAQNIKNKSEKTMYKNAKKSIRDNGTVTL